MNEGLSEEQRRVLKFEKRRMQPTFTVPSVLPCFMRIQGGLAEFTYLFDESGNAYIAWRLVDLTQFEIPELPAENYFPQRRSTH